ncbi:anthranilate synthase component I family protein [Paenibacillus thalictri]|uniref:Anthranilate synthase component I family protein n=1 Tax=Paenibacillus thalictri TaxID=2527873 RepID=A0A4Q9DFS4_9BACL|nr:anthranilate synthase component I family protein [Paenibacillus thalictri]TBL69042.1 anthranilate synthase component I family protein [Paenibacillus thalictri]
MRVTESKDWLEWNGEYEMLPYVERHPLTADRILSWEAAWTEASPYAFVLESGKGGRYTFLGLHPDEEIRGKGDRAIVTYRSGRKEELTGSALKLVKMWLGGARSPKVKGAPKWLGGCAGFWGYDVARSIEKLPVIANDDLELPDYCFVRVNRLWIIDHQEKTLYFAVHTHVPPESDSETVTRLYDAAADTAQEMKAQWERIAAVQRNPLLLQDVAERREQADRDKLQIDVEAVPGIRAEFDRGEFIAAVKRVQEYIGQGDIFQVNLSVRQSKRLHASPESIYEWLRIVNPSPYMGLQRFGDFQLVSGSPELLVQLEDGIIRTRPIAGTRPRGKTAEEDRALAEELIHHEKERAEHIMLVDLLRNDIGRVSAYGSVRVSDFMVIEYYSHVMHIVSQVEGTMAEGKDLYDVMASAFPGGTITGAPKVRTMEIIEELEPVRRGPYTGSMGWIDYNGNMEFNIIIRTMAVKDGIGYVQAGAGIVIDSVPEKEYTESLNKAKALWKAIQYSEAAGVMQG